MDSRPVVNIGEQRFDMLVGEKKFYIDKTELIREWWEYGSAVTLITRPRRFGKTLNLSMLECFFSVKFAGRGDLFEGFSIWKDEKYQKLQGTIPVIFISFANVKADTFEKMEYAVKKVVADLYGKNRYLLAGELLSPNEKEYYEGIKPDMGAEVAADAVNSMAAFMGRYYGKKVIILLDEYDAPMQEAWLHGYWDSAVSFFRSFFNSTFKTNENIYRGIITGITRIFEQGKWAWTL